MPYTVSARAAQARAQAALALRAHGLSERTAFEIAKRLSWSLARRILEELGTVAPCRKEETS